MAKTYEDIRSKFLGKQETESERQTGYNDIREKYLPSDGGTSSYQKQRQQYQQEHPSDWQNSLYSLAQTSAQQPVQPQTDPAQIPMLLRMLAGGTQMSSAYASIPKGVEGLGEYQDQRYQNYLEENKKKYQDYMALSGSDDFGQYSGYKSSRRNNVGPDGQEDGTYTYTSTINERVNKNPDTLVGYDNLEEMRYQNLTDDEIAIFNYLYNKEGYDSAKAFLDSFDTELNERTSKQAKEHYAEQAKEEGWLQTGARNVWESPRKIAGTIGNAINYVAKGGIDENAWYNSPGYIAQARDEAVMEGMSDTGKFFYQTGESIGNFMFNTLISAGIANAIGAASGVAKGSEAIKNIAENLSLSLMSSQAANSTVIELKNQGYSDSDAVKMAIISGFAEFITEKYSVEALMNMDSLHSGKMLYWLKNAFTEGSEEVASDAINLLGDIIVMKDKSQWEQKIRQYEAQGYTRAQATGLAIKDQALESGASFLGGFLSGGVMAGGVVGGSSINAIYQGNQFKQANGTDALMDLAKQGQYNDENSAAYKSSARLQRTLEEGRTPSALQVGNVLQYQANADMEQAESNKILSEAIKNVQQNSEITNEDAKAIRENQVALQELKTVSPDMKLTADGINEAVKSYMETNEDVIKSEFQQMERDYTGSGITTSEAQTATRQALGIETQIENANRIADTAENPELASMIKFAYDNVINTIDGQNVAGEDFAAAMIQSYNAGLEGKSGMQFTQGFPKSASSYINQAFTYGERVAKEGGINGGAEETQRQTNGGGTERFSRLGQPGGREEVRAELVKLSKRTDGGAEGKSYQAYVALQKDIRPFSGRSLGIREATNDETMYLIPKEAWNENLKKLEKAAAAEGYELVPFVGEIRLKDGTTARGAYKSDKGKLFVQVDNRSANSIQVALHELFHGISEKEGRKELHKKIKQQIQKDYPTEAKLREFFEAYVQAYEWAAEMSDEDLLEEIFADAYAGIDIIDYKNGKIIRTSELGGSVTAAVSGTEKTPEAKRGPPAINPSPTVTKDLNRNGVEIIGDSATKFSYDTWSATDKAKVLSSLIKAGFTKAEAQKWINDVNSISDIIASDRYRLDYDAADNQVMLKNNSEYVKTLDASTLCAKRLLYQGTFNRITELLPNTILMPDDLIRVRQIMDQMGDTVPCGICYVESRRKTLSKFAGQWLNEVYKGSVKVNMNDLTSTDGLEALRKKHPDVYNQYTSWMRARGTSNPKVVELRTAYRGDISKLTKGQIEKITRIGGLRVQSFSDFETVHLIDMMQAVLDMSAKGLTSQAYTKVPNFAWAFGDTGIKINLSLIGKAENGKLVFDSKEGMAIEDAMKLRDRYSDNVGTILVGANDESIRLAMADDRIDFIIPFHRSGWSKDQFEALGLSGYDDYQNYQNERNLDGSSIAEGNLYPIDYWDYTKTGKENAERYLEICKEQKRIPKFEKFLVNNGDGSWSLQPDGSTDGYWKMLIDFKMYNNEGIGVPQHQVIPNFNMAEAERILNEYSGEGNRSLPVDEKAARAFAKEYKKAHKGAARFSRTTDTNYMSAVQSGDMLTAQRMVDEAAQKNGYELSVYHGTGEYFNTFRMGAEGIHLGNIDQATQVAINRYETRSDYTLYKWGQINGKIPEMDNATRQNLVDYAYALGDYYETEGTENEFPFNGNLSDTAAVTDYVAKAVEGYAGDGIDADKVTIRMHTFDRKVGYNVMHLYAKMNNPFIINGDITEWSPANIADVLFARDQKRNTLRSKDISGSDITLTDTQKTILSKISVNAVKGDAAWNALADVLSEAGYDGIQYLNQYEGDKNSYSYIALHPSDVKSADAVTYDNKGKIIPLSKRFNNESNDIRYSRATAPEFYSKLQREIVAFKGDKIGASSAVSYLKGKGVKDEEIKWSGIETFLEGKKSVPKSELLQFLQDNELKIDEQVLDREYDPNNYSDYDNAQDEALQSAMKVLRDRGEHPRYADITVEYDADDGFTAYYKGEKVYNFDPEKMRIRWGDYKTPGGENYREILYKIPGSTYSNLSMKTHWGETGVVAHARVQDFETGDGKILFVDEIQSDWHNAGEKGGYAESETEITKKRVALEQQLETLNKEYNDLKAPVTYKEWQEAEAMANVFSSGVYGKVLSEFREYYDTHGLKDIPGNEWVIEGDLRERMLKAGEEYQRLAGEAEKKRIAYRDWDTKRGEITVQIRQIRRKLDALRSGNTSVPDAPFRNGTYIQYVLKDLLRKAAEGGYDYLAWTTGKMQEQRWSDAYAEGYRIEYDQDIPKFLSKYGKQWGAKLTQLTLSENGEEIDNFKKQIDEFYDLWSRVDPYDLEKEQIIDGLGLHSDGIDDSIEEIRDAGLSEEEIERMRTIAWSLDTAYEDGLISKEILEGPTVGNVPAIPVTDAMRESVLYEGQARFSRTSIEFDENTHTKEETQRFTEYLKSVDVKFIDFIENRTETGKTSRYEFGEVTEETAKELLSLTGENYSGYEYSINNSGMNHIENRHGENGKADNTMRMNEDVARMNYVVQNHDSVDFVRDYDGNVYYTEAFKDKNNNPAKVIRFAKKVDGDYVVVMAVAENSKKKLRVLTAFMAKNKDDITRASNADASTLNLTAKPAHTSLSSSNKKITEKNSSVNTDFSRAPLPENADKTAEEVVNNLYKKADLMAMSMKYGNYNAAAYTDKRMEQEIGYSYAEGSRNKDYARAYIAFMKPSDFIQATSSSIWRDTLYSEVKGKAKEEGRTSLLDLDALTNERQSMYLRITTDENGKVIIDGHEGRHRMIGLEAEGYKYVPVIIEPREYGYPDGQSRYHTKPVSSLYLEGQKFYEGHGTGIFVHDMLPLSANYADIARDVFAGDRNVTRFSRGSEIDQMSVLTDDMRQRYKDLEAEVLKQTQRAEYFKNETRLKLEKEGVDKYQVSDKGLNKIEQYLKKTYSSNAAIRDDLRTLINGFLNGRTAYDDAFNQALYIGNHLIANSKELVSHDDQVYQQLKEYLKKTRISISPSAKADIPDYEQFRRRNLSRIRLTADGIPVDVAYQELQGMFGKSYFPDVIDTQSDQLIHIDDVLRTLTPTFENIYTSTSDAEMAVEAVAMDIMNELINSDEIDKVAPTFADRQKRQREKAVAKAKEQTRTFYERKLDSLRKSKDNRIQELKDSAQRYRERRKDSEMRTKLLNIAKRLQNRKLPALQRQRLDEIIGDLDTVAKGITGRSIQNLTALRDWYEDRKANDPDFLRDPLTEERISRLEKRHIADMTQDEVLQLTMVLQNIENELAYEKKLIDEQERRDTYQLAYATINDIRNTKGTNVGLGRKIDEVLALNALSGERAIRRMTGYVDNDPLYQLMMKLSDGQRDMLDFQRRASHMVQQFVEDKAFVESITGKKANRIRISGMQGGERVEVDITPAERIALYLHSKNDSNLYHIEYGGITVPNFDLLIKGKTEDAYNKTKTIKLRPSEVRAITAQMTDKERAFANAISAYFNGMSQNEINAVSEKLKGYSLAMVENYFPIETDKAFLGREYESLQMDGTIEGMGFLKERIQKASTPIMLREAQQVMNQSVRMTSKYVGLAIPIRNVGKVNKVNLANWHSDGTYDLHEDSINKAIEDKWGNAGTKYIETLMADLQNPYQDHDTLSKLYNAITSNYAGAVLEMNLGVAIKQAASYPTAMAVLGFKPLAQAMGQWGRVDLRTIEKYTPLQWYRSQGYSTTELGDMASGISKDAPTWLKWIQGMDLITTRKLWKASEIYVQENSPNLVQGTDDYYKEVARIYNRVIEETQPNYTVMQRPGHLRSKNAITRALNMFKTQPYQNFGILYDAVQNFKAKQTQYQTMRSPEAEKGLIQARKDLSRAIVSQLVSSLLFAAMQLLWDVLRHKTDKYEDDKGKATAESIARGFGTNVLTNGFGMVPFGSVALEFVEATTDQVAKALGKDAVFNQSFYGMDVPVVESLNGILEGAGSAIKVIAKTTNAVANGDDVDAWETARDLYKATADGFQALGVPVKNTVNLFNAIMQNGAWAFKSLGGNRYMGNYLSLRIQGANNTQMYQNLYQAYQNDKAAYQELYNQMVSDGYSETAIKNYFKKME